MIARTRLALGFAPQKQVAEQVEAEVEQHHRPQVRCQVRFAEAVVLQHLAAGPQAGQLVVNGGAGWANKRFRSNIASTAGVFGPPALATY